MICLKSIIQVELILFTNLSLIFIKISPISDSNILFHLSFCAIRKSIIAHDDLTEL